MQATGLNDVEQDFVEFLSGMNGVPAGDVARTYLKLKPEFGFDGKGYREFCLKSQEVHSLLYDSTDERQLMEFYRRLEFVNLLRHVSYSYTLDTKPKLRLERRLKEMAGLRQRGAGQGKTRRERMRDIAAMIASKAGDSPTVVDYGCGLAYQSFEIA